MSAAENKAILLRLYEDMFSQGNTTVIPDLIAADAIDHEDYPGLTGSTPEKIAQVAPLFHAAMPHLRVTAEDLIAEDDTVVARFVMHGTHQGAWMGVPATGKRITMAGIDIVRFAHGKLVEHWAQSDTLGVLQQLAVRPMP